MQHTLAMLRVEAAVCMRTHANAGELTGLEKTTRIDGACDVSQVDGALRETKILTPKQIPKSNELF